MAMIEFVRDYSDHSTDRGYQFEFRCDHCYSGFMSSYSPSMIGSAGSLLEAAGSVFGGIFGSVGNSAYDIQRAVGGPAHDRALQQAVTEVKEKFRRCQRCGKWVCKDVCWNDRASQCTGCNPKLEQEALSIRTQEQVSATAQQLRDKAADIDYTSGIDMHVGTQQQVNAGGYSPQASAQNAAYGATAAAASASRNCTSCGAALTGSKFCPECGASARPPEPKACGACGHTSSPTARFCEECGGKLG